MRSQLLVLLSVFWWLAGGQWQVALAYHVEKGGIYYNLIGTRRAFVTHSEWQTDGNGPSKPYIGRVVIPSQISHDGRIYTVVSVGQNAFAGCEGLTSVQLPSTVRAVSACAFLGCTSLRQVSMPATILSINPCSFTGCTSLQQISLPRHAEIVDTLTFYCCVSLKSIVLPYSVRMVCQGAMEHLSALTDLYCFSSEPPVAEHGAFTLSDQQHCTLHVPADAVDLYRSSPRWSDFYRIVPLSDADYKKQSYQRGDVNDDGLVDADDLVLLSRLIVRLPDYSGLRWAADINGDGIVNAVDYVSLAKKLSGR